MSDDNRNTDLDAEGKVRIIYRGAIAVIVGVLVTVLMFARLASTSLMVSYEKAEVSLVSVPVALLDEIVYSLLIGIAAGVVVLVIIFGIGSGMAVKKDK